MSPNIYLPIIVSPGYVLPARLGAQIDGSVNGSFEWVVANRFYELHAKWKDVEYVRGTYDWSMYDSDFTKMKDYPIVASIKVVPEWARLWPDFVGSPPREDTFQELAEYVIEVCRRYQNIVAVELFNEPDVDVVDGKDVGEYYGSWVKDRDYYAGGTYYGKMLSYVIPIIRSALPNIKILAGAFMSVKGNSIPFIDATLAEQFQADAITFHAYSYYNAGDEDNIKNWASILKSKTDMKLGVTETSLIWYSDSTDFRNKQGDFLHKLLTEFDGLGVEFVQWYSMGGRWTGEWMCSNLISGVAQPAYVEFIEGIHTTAMPQPTQKLYQKFLNKIRGLIWTKSL